MKIELEIKEIIRQKGDFVIASIVLPNIDVWVMYNTANKEVYDILLDDSYHFAIDMFDQLTGN